MEPQIGHSQTPDGMIVPGAPTAPEWHAFLAFHGRRSRLVGRVEAVDREVIRLTRIDLDPGSRDDVEVCVSWKDVDCIAVCGPDRDQDLFDLLRDETDS